MVAPVLGGLVDVISDVLEHLVNMLANCSAAGHQSILYIDILILEVIFSVFLPNEVIQEVEELSVCHRPFYLSRKQEYKVAELANKTVQILGSSFTFQAIKWGCTILKQREHCHGHAVWLFHRG